MPKPRKIALETPTARAKLTPRKASYFVRVAPHIALGYRRNASGFGTWSVRFADGSASGWLKIALRDLKALNSTRTIGNSAITV